MTIKRWVASKDTTITNAYFGNLTTRATKSNMGASDVLEVFSIYAQASTASVELSRVLIEFPVNEIIDARNAAEVPASGAVSYFLKMSNTPHSFTTPVGYYLTVQAVSSAWAEGNGLDMEEYSDLGVANWESSSLSTSWNTQGGDYHASPKYNTYFDAGDEDLEVNITSVVEEWIDGTKENNGLGIQLSSSLESTARSYYTKKLFGRNSEFFFKRPYIEARWDASLKDDRGNFYASSSLLPATQNLNKLYFYNRFRGRNYNIPEVGTGPIYVSLYSGSSLGVPTGSALILHDGNSTITGSYVRTGIYSASVGVNTAASILYDVWHNNETGVNYKEYFTGSAITLYNRTNLDNYEIKKYALNVTNLKAIYSTKETAKLRIFSRGADWQPTIYTVAINEIEVEPIDNAFYKIVRVEDGVDIIPYGTGSDNHTLTSYDKLGNYFNLDMSLLEAGYAYAIKFVFLQDGEYREQPSSFKFRVE